MSNGHVWAEGIDDVEADTLQSLISRKVLTDLPFVLIPGKLIPGLPHEDMFIASPIIVNDNTGMEKEIISIALRDYRDFLNENLR